MNTTTLIRHQMQGTRALADAYTEILLDAVKDDPSFGGVVLSRDPDDESPLALHRGTVLACEVLSRTSCAESTNALLSSLRELHEAPWLTLAHVQGLLELAARPEDHSLAEAQARSIAIAGNGYPCVEAHGCRLTLQRNWWVIKSPADQECYRCLQLSSALRHAQLLHLTPLTYS